MTDLVIRRMGFDFEEPVEFMWQPANPRFAVFGNAFTFIAVPFEKYIFRVLRLARERITDPAMIAEADAFLKQEAQHSGAHRRHMTALTRRYPGLEQVYEQAQQRYYDLVERESVEFNVAYIANLEATFTPLFTMALNNVDSLLRGGDPRVAALLTWHFVEEIEHRSSGLLIYDHLVGKRWERTRSMGATFKHVASVMSGIVAGFDEHVPLADRKISCVEAMSESMYRSEFRRRRARADVGGAPSMLHAVPRRHLASMAWYLLMSQTPWHDPDHQPLPDLAHRWMRAYAQGADLTHFDDQRLAVA